MPLCRATRYPIPRPCRVFRNKRSLSQNRDAKARVRVSARYADHDRVEDGDGDGELFARRGDFRCATIDPVFRSPRKLDSFLANGNPYLVSVRRGDRYRHISPDIHDTRRPMSTGETERKSDKRRLCMSACLRLCQTRERTIKTSNSLRGPPIFTSINRETRRIITNLESSRNRRRPVEKLPCLSDTSNIV